MEGIASASAIVGLIAFSGDLLCAGYGYIAKVAKAPAEIRVLLSEVASLNLLLERLRMYASEDEKSYANNTLQALDELGVFQDCDRLLRVVESCLEKCREVAGQEKRNIGRMLLWPFKEKETKDVRTQLERLIKTLSVALTVDSATALKELKKAQDRVAVSVDALVESSVLQAKHEKERRLLKWLCPEEVDPEQNFEAALLSRQPFTGKWFLESAKFTSWLDTKNSLLWLHGIPGCGKTVLSATIIEHLRSTALSQDTGLVYFYFDHRDLGKQTVKNFAATAITQLVRQNSSCLSDIAAEFESRGCDVSQSLPASKYIPLLRSMAQKFIRTFVVLDALDECNEIAALSKSIQELLVAAPCSSIQLLATSRHDLTIERLVLPLATDQLSLMRDIKQDIVTYVIVEVEERIRTKRLKLRNPDLAKQIKSALLKNSDGMFLRAKIQIEHLSTLSSDKAIKEALDVLPEGLDDTYEAVLRHIVLSNPGRVDELKRIFRWLIGCEYILKVDELAEAVSINPEDTRLDPDGIATDPEDLAALCSSLVTVNRRYNPPEISFAHYSIEEYLRSARIFNSPMAEFHMERHDVNLQLATTCLQYLSFADFEKPIPTGSVELAPARRQRLWQYRILGYAANNWHRHLKNSGSCLDVIDEEMKKRLQWFLRPNLHGLHYTSWQQVIHSRYQSIAHSKSFALDCTLHPPLYNAIVFGLNGVAIYLLEAETDVAKMVSHGLTPLHAAAMQGHPALVQKLLDAGVPIDAVTTDKGSRRLTALHIAAEAGRVEMVRILLAAGASPHAQSAAKTTPFYKAARGGSLPVLELLHDAGSDVNVQTWDNWTPIFEAIISNHVLVVKRLLEWGADPEVVNRNGSTPLSMAKALNRDAIVKLLEDCIAAYENEEEDKEMADDGCDVIFEASDGVLKGGIRAG